MILVAEWKSARSFLLSSQVSRNVVYFRFRFLLSPNGRVLPSFVRFARRTLGEMPSLPLHHCTVDWSIDEIFQKQQLNDVHERLSIRFYSMAFRCAAIFDKIARLFFRKSP